MNERLAACVQVVGPIRSTYRWEGRVETATEWLCLAKTTAGVLARSRAQAARSNSAYPAGRAARRVGSVVGCTGPLSGPAGERQCVVTIRFRPASFAR